MSKFKKLAAAALLGALVLVAVVALADEPQPAVEQRQEPQPAIEQQQEPQPAVEQQQDRLHIENEITQEEEAAQEPEQEITQEYQQEITQEYQQENPEETITEVNIPGETLRGKIEDLLGGPNFLSFTGTVVEIVPVLGNDGLPATDQHYVRIRSEYYGTTIFRTDHETFVLGKAIEVGDTITGWFTAADPAVLTYPPQHLARVITGGTFENVKIDRFHLDEVRGALVSSRRDLVLNFMQDTPIMLQTGARFFVPEGSALLNELDGRLLVVTHGATDAAMPGGTLPSDPSLSITVLVENAENMPETFNPQRYTNEGITVNSQRLDVTWQQINETPYVPFRAVVDALGHGDSVVWEGISRTVKAHNGTDSIVFPIDSIHFIAGSNIVSLPQPAVIQDGTTYVPWQFFRDVFGVNAWFSGGQVFVDREYAMQ
ncbi:MAG: copper amine oxidase N-terminal domain-containing protein [Clostridiales bacterium]|jgi:hypothetical protein|nr:copper amine oxidase N-terminal domain-containing protein [Clostridiales bacterium]